MKLFKTACSLSSLILLTGCLSLTPAALIEMARFSPLSMDASNVAIAIAMPSDIRVVDRSAQLMIVYKSAKDGEVLIEERMTFDIESGAKVDGAPQAGSGQHVQVARLFPADAERLTKVQKSILQLKQSGFDGKGSMSIGVSKVCYENEKPSELPQKIFLRTREGGTFIQMTSTADFLQIAADNKKMPIEQILVPCSPN